MAYSRLLGSILLIIGTTIGGGMFALPVVTAAGGFWPSTWLLCGIWALMTLTAFIMLEVNLWFPPESNLFSMARATLGSIGATITAVSYMLLLYCLLAAYVAGGSDLMHQWSSSIGITLSRAWGTLLFVGFFAIIVWHGMQWVDHVNRGLMSIKMLAYALLVCTIAPFVNWQQLPPSHPVALHSAILVSVTSFGYAIIVPSLRTYLQSDVHALRIVILIGSAIPLFCYIAWNYVVQGSLGVDTLQRLHETDADVVSALMTGLAQTGAFQIFVHVFTSVCVLTAFLSVSLALSDFLADGLQLQKSGKEKWVVYLLTFVPPMLLVCFFPHVFIAGLRYAGLFCIVILLLLPVCMAFAGRYVQHRVTDRNTMVGGKGLLYLLFLGSCLLLAMH